MYSAFSADGEGKSAQPSESRNDAKDVPSSNKRRRRSARSKAAGAEELWERWRWLSDIKPEDKPWIYFAMHRAYHSKVADYGGVVDFFTYI